MTGTGTWLLCAAVVAVGCVFGQLTAGLRGRPRAQKRLQGGAAAAYAAMALLDAAERNWAAMCIMLALAAAWFWIWRSGGGGRKRKRSLRELGHKARARVEALARNMPRPAARRPVPQGSPA